MLKLTGITKEYDVGSNKIVALGGIDLEFRKNEFVCILGPSGCGKTTMLNIIGGLDRYTSGDLCIDGVSTREYKDVDWDIYRNNSVGFVFQNYNLIPHQSVLSNVELALTLSGVSKSERKKRAHEVLEKVGLGDQASKKPNQMSGGQMQRVAIARSLVNNPEILLADEPTGALDSGTSVQIMEILKGISEDKLVIMVTHNPELAEKYATRIIRLLDGRVTDDSNPYSSADEATSAEIAEKKKSKKKKKVSMSFFTALSLSLNNLLTKKTRTLLTSFAGSIGIVGIALILSLSNGMQAYIDSLEKDTLSSYPLVIESQSVDMTDMMSSFAQNAPNEDEGPGHELDKVYANSTITQMMKNMSAQVSNNDLKTFKAFLDKNTEIKDYTTAIQYGYQLDLQIFKANTDSGVTQVNPSELGSMMQMPQMGMFGGGNVWSEMLGNPELLEAQYDVVSGRWAKEYNEVVLVVDKNNEISDVTLYALGIKDAAELTKLIASAGNAMQSKTEAETTVVGETTDAATTTAAPEAEEEQESYTYDDLLNLRFKLILNTDYYQKEKGVWVDKSGDEDYMKKLVDNGLEIKIVGIVRQSEEAVSSSIGGSVGYLSSLTEYVADRINETEIVKEQKAKPKTDILTGLPFMETEEEAAAKAENEESTTAPAAENVSVYKKPTVSSLDKKGNADTLALAEEFTMPADVKAVTESEVYAYIDEHYKGAERDEMREIARLLLKDVRTSKEREKLIAFFDKVLASQQGSGIEGMENVTSAQIYTYIQLMDKNTKLQLFSALMNAENGQKPSDEQTTAAGGSSSQKPSASKPSSGTSATEPITEPEEPKIVYSESSYEENLGILGVVDLSTPSTINIYPKNFEAKEQIEILIDQYNKEQTDSGHEEYVIGYTDVVGLIMSSVTSIINIVTYVLIAFVAISLIVSSIMIGIITYISVLERTKEIGILRAIGASKKDISRVFNAETVIVGFTAGVFGILLTLLLNIPIGLIIKALVHVSGLAVLPVYGAVALIVISVLLTMVAGLIPSKIAAKKDPVESLRTE